MNTRRIHNLLHPKVGEVWMLHRIAASRSADPALRRYELTPIYLEQLLIESRSHGAHFVGLDEGLHSRHDVSLTFDDGYADNLTLALPILERLEVPFTVYVTTDFIDNRRPMWWYPDQQLGLTTPQLLQLASSPLCTIGAHTVSHPHLSSLSRDEQHSEIMRSKTLLEQLLGREIRHFAYPHGDYNACTLAIVRQLGFATAVTTSGRTVRNDVDPLQLDRITIVQP